MPTNFSTNRRVTQTYVGTYIEKTADPTFNQDGTLKSSVQYAVRNYTSPNLQISALIESRVGGITAGFSSRNRPPLLAPLGFSYEKYELGNSSAVSWNFRSGSSTIAPISNQIYESPTLRVPASGIAATVAQVSSLENEARAALLAKIKGMSVNAAQAMAERKQTAKLVGDTAITIAKAVRAVRRGDVIGAAKALGVKRPRSTRVSRSSQVGDAAAQHWLALQYGWKPLLSDVYGAAEQLAKNSRNIQYQRASVLKSGVYEVSTRVNTPPPSGWSGPDLQVTRITEKVDVRMGCVFQQTSPVTTMKEIGLTNPALLAWELLPFSFVADWFLPIGGFLNNIDATLGLTFHSGYKTVFREVNGYSYWTKGLVRNSGTVTEFTQLNAQNTWKSISVRREPQVGFPANPLPSFKNPASVNHALNAIALLKQSFKR
jgi:hypothetical protein